MFVTTMFTLAIILAYASYVQCCEHDEEDKDKKDQTIDK